VISMQEKLVVFAVEVSVPVTRNRTAPQKQVRPPSTPTARTIQRGWITMEMAVTGMQIMVAPMPVLLVMIATLMRMQLVASVAEGLIPASPSKSVAPTIQRGRMNLEMAVTGMQIMVAAIPVLMLMSATLMRMRHVASVAEGLIPASPNRAVDHHHAPTIQRGWMSLEMAANGMQIMVALMPIYMLIIATLLRMQLVASVMEAFRLESLNRPVSDVV
jgi:hypothetical protein